MGAGAAAAAIERTEPLTEEEQLRQQELEEQERKLAEIQERQRQLMEQEQKLLQ